MNRDRDSKRSSFSSTTIRTQTSIGPNHQHKTNDDDNAPVVRLTMRIRPSRQRRGRRSWGHDLIFLFWILLGLVLAAVLVVSSSSSSSSLPLRRSVKNEDIHNRPHRHIEMPFQILFKSIKRQIDETTYHTNKQHHHRVFLSNRATRIDPTTCAPVSLRQWLWYYTRVGLAGGIAGASGTVLLFPVDSAKTLVQSSPEKYGSVSIALRRLIVSESGQVQLGRAFHGLGPALLGAVPSSAIYFGAYESCKTLLKRTLNDSGRDQSATNRTSVRLLVHGAAAVSGNLLSSAVFVPKELIKQQMQYTGTNSVRQTVSQIISESGPRGLYRGYKATLARNIPSAVLRFVLYEELKLIMKPMRARDSVQTSDEHSGLSWRLFLAGAVAGAVASGLMTPFDVLKTRVSTGTCPVDLPSCLHYVVGSSGWAGLYAGAGSRMLFSGMFSAMGFGTLEAAKKWLGVSRSHDMLTQRRPPVAVGPLPSTVNKLRSPWQRLEHAISDRFE